uniref:Uncharacterized protein n=1 Tax=viral metagenome TaxID=1070528 RepID=A0A6C0CJH0_9ZZZZ
METKNKMSSIKDELKEALQTFANGKCKQSDCLNEIVLDLIKTASEKIEERSDNIMAQVDEYEINYHNRENNLHNFEFRKSEGPNEYLVKLGNNKWYHYRSEGPLHKYVNVICGRNPDLWLDDYDRGLVDFMTKCPKCKKPTKFEYNDSLGAPFNHIKLVYCDDHYHYKYDGEKGVHMQYTTTYNQTLPHGGTVEQHGWIVMNPPVPEYKQIEKMLGMKKQEIEKLEKEIDELRKRSEELRV